VEIRSVKHKGLRRFIENDDHSGLPAKFVDKIRDIVTALLIAENMSDLPKLPGWRLHPLKGSRKGQWSIVLTGNFRIVFEVRDNEIYKLTLEDYH